MSRCTVVVSLSLLCSCGPRVTPLHLKEAWAGTVRIEVEEAGKPRAIEGELTFHRRTPNLQWVVRPDSSTANALSRGEDRKTDAFTNGVPRAPTAAELADYELVRSVVEPPPPAPTIRALSPSSYSFHDGKRTVRVSMFETNQQHGKR